MSVADWDNEYARLARAATQLRTPGLVASTATDLPSLQQALRRLARQAEELGLPAAEAMRRQRLVEHLLQTTQSQSPGGLGLGSDERAPTQQPPYASSQMSMAMRQQDDLIDELAVGIGRLKHQTVSIGEEASMHVNLLNQMEVGLDEAQAGLDAETRRAARLRQDQSVWRLQLILAGEFLLLIMLIFLGLT